MKDTTNFLDDDAPKILAHAYNDGSFVPPTIENNSDIMFRMKVAQEALLEPQWAGKSGTSELTDEVERRIKAILAQEAQLEQTFEQASPDQKRMLGDGDSVYTQAREKEASDDPPSTAQEGKKSAAPSSLVDTTNEVANAELNDVSSQPSSADAVGGDSDPPATPSAQEIEAQIGNDGNGVPPTPAVESGEIPFGPPAPGEQDSPSASKSPPPRPNDLESAIGSIQGGRDTNRLDKTVVLGSDAIVNAYRNELLALGGINNRGQVTFSEYRQFEIMRNVAARHNLELVKVMDLEVPMMSSAKVWMRKAFNIDTTHRIQTFAIGNSKFVAEKIQEARSLNKQLGDIGLIKDSRFIEPAKDDASGISKQASGEQPARATFEGARGGSTDDAVITAKGAPGMHIILSHVQVKQKDYDEYRREAKEEIKTKKGGSEEVFSGTPQEQALARLNAKVISPTEKLLAPERDAIAQRSGGASLAVTTLNIARQLDKDPVNPDLALLAKEGRQKLLTDLAAVTVKVTDVRNIKGSETVLKSSPQMPSVSDRLKELIAEESRADPQFREQAQARLEQLQQAGSISAKQVSKSMALIDKGLALGARLALEEGRSSSKDAQSTESAKPDSDAKVSSQDSATAPKVTEQTSSKEAGAPSTTAPRATAGDNVASVEKSSEATPVAPPSEPTQAKTTPQAESKAESKAESLDSTARVVDPVAVKEVATQTNEQPKEIASAAQSVAQTNSRQAEPSVGPVSAPGQDTQAAAPLKEPLSLVDRMDQVLTQRPPNKEALRDLLVAVEANHAKPATEALSKDPEAAVSGLDKLDKLLDLAKKGDYGPQLKSYADSLESVSASWREQAQESARAKIAQLSSLLGESATFTGDKASQARTDSVAKEQTNREADKVAERVADRSVASAKQSAAVTAMAPGTGSQSQADISRSAAMTPGRSAQRILNRFGSPQRTFVQPNNRKRLNTDAVRAMVSDVNKLDVAQVKKELQPNAVAALAAYTQRLSEHLERGTVTGVSREQVQQFKEKVNEIANAVTPGATLPQSAQTNDRTLDKVFNRLAEREAEQVRADISSSENKLDRINPSVMVGQRLKETQGLEPKAYAREAVSTIYNGDTLTEAKAGFLLRNVAKLDTPEFKSMTPTEQARTLTALEKLAMEVNHNEHGNLPASLVKQAEQAMPLIMDKVNEMAKTASGNVELLRAMTSLNNPSQANTDLDKGAKSDLNNMNDKASGGLDVSGAKPDAQTPRNTRGMDR